MVVGVEQQGGVSLAAQMGLPDSFQIDIDHGVAIHDDEVVRQKIQARQHRPRRAQRRALHHDANPHAPPAAVAKMRVDQVGPVTGKDDDILKIMAPGQFNLVLEEGLATDGDHRLGQIAQPAAQSRSQAAGKNDQLFHVVSGWPQPAANEFYFAEKFSRMARSTASLLDSFGDQPSALSFSMA